MHYGVVLSPFYGQIKKVAIQEKSRIYEWDPLFQVITDSGIVETIHTGLSGKIQSLEVQEGDKVIPGMVLAYVNEDLFVTGSD